MRRLVSVEGSESHVVATLVVPRGGARLVRGADARNGHVHATYLAVVRVMHDLK
jgi:hypothetical protein